jgi:anaphase-promoting complex subunit 10
LDFSQDESYTPKQLCIKAGNSLTDLQQIQFLDLNEPSGWIAVELHTDDHLLSLLKAYFVQVQILANHQNGKDCHVRGLRVYSPIENFGLQESDMLPFSSLEFQM